MTENPTDYSVRIGPTDRYRHLHIKRHGKIVFFRLQYETKIDDEWHPVVRYDTAHGFVHRDLMSLKGITSKTPLFNQDYNDALTFAENDLKLNWEYYKERFLEGQLMNKQKEMIERNIELSAEFSRYLFEHSELEKTIPGDAEIVLLPDYDEELKKFNLELGKDIENSGGKVAYVTIKGIRPKMLSRIENIELKYVA